MANTPIPEDRFAQYARAFAYCLDQCADDVHRRPDAALWNARRAAESLVGAVFSRKAKGAKGKDEDLAARANALAEWFPDVRPWLDDLRGRGNDGAHLREWVPVDPQWADAELVAEKAARGARWFIETSRSERWGLDPETELAIQKHADDLERVAHEPRPTKLCLARHLDAEVAEIGAKLAAEVERSARLEHDLRDAQREPGEALAPHGGTALPSPAGTSANAAPRRHERPLYLTVLLCASAGALSYATAAAVRTSPPGAQAAASIPVASAVPSAVDVHVEPPASASAAAAAIPDPSRPPTCPAGMIALARGSLDLRQPWPRKAWPPATKDPLRVEVAEFCVMPEAVSARAYRECVTAGKCDAPVRGCIANPAGPLPMNCIDHAQADAYCRGIGGSLPRLAEVEQAFRVASGRLVLATDTSEWVEDAFPSPTLERGAPVPCDEAGCWHMWFKAQGDPSLPNPRMSWNQGTKGSSTLSFRCVVRAAER